MSNGDPSARAALESILLEDLDAREPWLVYADWLQSRGDPRGLLIAAHAKGEDASALIERHSDVFLGPFADALEPYVELTWHMGFWSRIKVSCSYERVASMPDSVHKFGGISEIVGRVLRHPSARFLGALSIGLTEEVADGEAQWQTSLDSITDAGLRPTLRELFVGDYDRGVDIGISGAQIGTLERVWAVLPNLETLTVQGGGIDLGAIAAPKLRKLCLWTGGLPQEALMQVTAASLPSLEHLELWFGSDNYGATCTSADVVALLQSKGLPMLRTLGLMDSEFANELPALIAVSPLLPQLEVLDLSLGAMTSEGGRALVEHAAAFRHLETLNLDQNFIGSEVAARIAAALPNATLGHQGNENDYVYVSVGE